MKDITKKRISAIAWPLIYLGLVITICISGCMVFKRYYYCSVFVSGQSMAPTLKGGYGNGDRGVAHFGIVDTSESAKKRIERFDIVTTYYPWDISDYADYQVGQTKLDGVRPERKIKRVLAIPGETISVKEGNITIAPNATAVTSIDANGSYKLGVADDSRTTTENQYFSSLADTCLYYTPSYEKGYNVFLEPVSSDSTTEFYLKYKMNETTDKYINVFTNGNANKITADMTGSSVWTLNDKYNALQTKVTGHTDDSYDGQYMFTLNKESTKFTTVKTTSVSLENEYPVQLLARDDTKVVVYSKNYIEDCEYKNELLPFRREFDNKGDNYKDFEDVVLNKGRLWVQGDHWGNSTDCYKNGPIYYENLEGVLIVIEGTCTISYNKKGEKICTNHDYSKPQIL